MHGNFSSPKRNKSLSERKNAEFEQQMHFFRFEFQKLIFNFVLQYWNIHITIDVIKTLTPLAVNETTVPVMIEPLEYPKFMTWRILPEEYIKKIVREVLIEDKKDNEQLVKLGIIQFLRQLKTYKAQDYTALTQELIQFTTKQDTHRGIKLEDYIPNLSGFFR